MKYSHAQKRLFWRAAQAVLADREAKGDALHWARNVMSILKGQL